MYNDGDDYCYNYKMVVCVNLFIIAERKLRVFIFMN